MAPPFLSCYTVGWQNVNRSSLCFTFEAEGAIRGGDQPHGGDIMPLEPLNLSAKRSWKSALAFGVVYAFGGFLTGMTVVLFGAHLILPPRGS